MSGRGTRGWSTCTFAGCAARSAMVRSSYLAEQSSLDDLRKKLIEAAIAAAIGGALLGAVLATSLSLRLRRAAAAAEQVAGGDLDARIDARGHDEVAALGQAVDRMA